MGTIAGDELGSWERVQEIGGVVGGGGGKEERILVSVRLRPLNEKEIYNKDPCDWECINDTTIIFKNSLPERSMYPTAYTFDKVFRKDCTTRRVYEEGAKEVALSVVSGINSSIFAYGQTSSGKTYTMSGITEYSVADIYDYIQKHHEREFVLKFSAMEIYNEAVRDLLSADSTPLRLLDDPERGTIVEKLTEETLRDWNHLKELLAICEAQRQIGETSLNETSSRSHQILRLTIESSAREYLGKDNLSTLSASVNFVDLAGSERASQAMSAGARLKEGCHINRSLLTLGTVIRKLSKGRNGHIPYRDSKLTRILQLSLGGNARTAIICTMSPARSYIEQSRNTLLFASCAKEVVTNAQVNVVMSDKALVKHLQRELARLENELRYPYPAMAHSEGMIREKDIQIRKMEKELKELMQQRDLAQSRLEDLLHTVKGDQLNREPFSPFHFSNANKDDDDVLSDSSSISFQPPSFNAKRINTSLRSANNKTVSNAACNAPNAEKQNYHGAATAKLNISSPTFIGLLQHDGEDITSDNNEEFEDLCKEVRCIEMDEISLSKSGALAAVEDNSTVEVLAPDVNDDIDSSNHGSEERVCTLEQQQLEHGKMTKEFPSKMFCAEPSPWFPMARDFPSSKSAVLSRSRSCQATLLQSPGSPWFSEEVPDEKTPPSMTFKHFPGRPEGVQRRTLTMNFSTENDTPSVDGHEESKSTAPDFVPRNPKIKTRSEEEITGICDFVAGMKEMAQIQYQKQCANGQIVEEESNGSHAMERSVKDVGLDPMLDSAESPPRWAFEFEQQQREIIALWHECNVALVHRTYFFLLFRGEPADSIYMEVELRRLSFLKITCAEGAEAHRSKVGDGAVMTHMSSSKALRREREMLCRRMNRRLTAEERECLYRKWGIALESKSRRVQLSRLLWSRTDDMEHVRESAALVAKLIGLLEPGLALKEMFGLSFTPQTTNRRNRSSSWRYGVPSLV